jgi:hypothetical protein
MATAPAMAPFVWGEVNFDARESPEHIVVRKEAERIAGVGEFWWGVDAPLGITVEVKAEQNGGTLPVLFSRPGRPTNNRAVKCGSGIRGEASFTLSNTVVFRVI